MNIDVGGVYNIFSCTYEMYGAVFECIALFADTVLCDEAESGKYNNEFVHGVVCMFFVFVNSTF